MISGIDPKIDIAFKKVFGSESHRDLTVALINAVLQPPPEHRVVEVNLLNPYSEKMHLNDKLSILDVKVRDQSDCLYDLEMQMLAMAALSPRVLYYWAKLYGEQLAAGDNYSGLRRTISICFVNGKVFRDWPDCHTCFRLLDPSGELCMTENLEIRVFELPKFSKTLAELEEPLDFWLHFLKNGAELDAEALPPESGWDDVRKAVGVLTMLAQNTLERELYEGRLKAKRDMQTLESERRRAIEQWHEAIEQRQAAEANSRYWQERCEADNREARGVVIRQIQRCERLLGRPHSVVEQLTDRSLEQLGELAESLEQELDDLAASGGNGA